MLRPKLKIHINGTQSEKLKVYVKKVSELILKRKLRLCQLAEIVVTFTNAEIASLQTKNEQWQREIKTNIPKARDFSLYKE